MSLIYSITNNINNKKYVGKTSRTLKERINEHRLIASSNSKNKGAIHHAISKYGIDNFSIKCIEECDTVRENQREMYWIKMLNTYGAGYNLTVGGEGVILARKDWGTNCNSKAVSKYDLDNNHICDYDSIGLASSEILGKSRRLDGKPSIRRCCNGKQSFAHGYKWSWKDCDLPDVSHKRPYTKGRVYGVHKDGTKKYWETPNDCVMELTGKQSNNASVSYSLRSPIDNKRCAHGWYLFYNKRESTGTITPRQCYKFRQLPTTSKNKFKGVSITNPDDIVYYDSYKDLKKDNIHPSNVYRNINDIAKGKVWTNCNNRQWYLI